MCYDWQLISLSSLDKHISPFCQILKIISLSLRNPFGELRGHILKLF